MAALNTERLIIRDYENGDLHYLHRMLSDKKNMYYLDDIIANTLDETAENLNAAMTNADGHYFCVCDKNSLEPIGSVGYTITAETPAGKVAHMGYWLLPEYHGKGYMTEAVKAVLEFAFLSDNCARITTGCYSENIPSRKVMEKAGFRKEGERIKAAWHDGRFKDRLDYAINADEFIACKSIAKINDENNPPDLSKIKCFALDMDGTFYLGNSIIDGSMDFLRRVTETGRKFIFLTNNSSKSKDEYICKLSGMGLEITEKELVTSGQATIEYLLENYNGKSVYLLGNPALRAEFETAGIAISDNPDMLVTAFDTALDYAKLCKVCDLVREGLPYVATHPDFNCPVENGFIPDIGALHAYVHASTGRMPDMIIGKPYAGIIDCALSQAGFSASEAAIVGDRLYTDIASAANTPGLTSILVLSGEAKLSDLSGSAVKPHFIFDSLKRMIPFL